MRRLNSPLLLATGILDLLYVLGASRTVRSWAGLHLDRKRQTHVNNLYRKLGTSSRTHPGGGQRQIARPDLVPKLHPLLHPADDASPPVPPYHQRRLDERSRK